MIFAGDRGMRVTTGAKTKRRTGTIFPLLKGRQIHSCDHAGAISHRHAAAQCALHVVDQIILLHLVRRATGDACMQRRNQ